MAFSRYRSAKEGPSELNLIPIMNLFVVLIPFLLAGAAFLRIGVIPTSLPQNNPSEGDVPKTPTTVLCNLAIDDKAMTLTVASVSLTPEELQALGAVFARKPDGAYDIQGLQDHLKGLKIKYPGSNTLTLMPDDRVKYQDIVKILDKTREYKGEGLNEKGEEKYEQLFPVTIFSKIIKAPPGEDGDLSFDEEAKP